MYHNCTNKCKILVIAYVDRSWILYYRAESHCCFTAVATAAADQNQKLLSGLF